MLTQQQRTVQQIQVFIDNYTSMYRTFKNRLASGPRILGLDMCGWTA